MVGAAKKDQRPFTMVRRSIWRSKRFASLPGDDVRFLYFYYLTCPHQTSVGCCSVPEAYVTTDLAMIGAQWTVEKYRGAREALINSELILVDDETGEILVTRWWQDNSPNNESWFSGAQRQCEAIQSLKLRESAQEALRGCREAFLASKLPTSLRTATERISALTNRR